MATALNDERVGEILRVQDQLYSDRADFNSTWQTVSERVLPNYSDFTTSQTPGQRRTGKVFESSAVLALEHFCAAMESMLCPASTRWHSLRAADKNLQGDIQIQQYLDKVTDCLFAARYAPQANFQAQIHEVFAQIGAFGNGPIIVDDIVGFGMRYRALHLAEVYGQENSAGVIDRVYRIYKLKAVACVDALKRGIFDTLPKEIIETADKAPQQQFEFVHAMLPNDDIKSGAKDHTGMVFSSYIVCKDLKTMVKESGYHTQAMLFPRYRVAPKETYGRGPGVDALPDILMLQEMEKANIRQAQRAIQPPIMLADDGALQSFDLRGDALNFGMLSADGKPLAVPFQSGSNLQIAMEFLERKVKVIDSHFLTDIFSILTEPTPQMTATEVLQRAQEKGNLLAPVAGRAQSECFGPMITREIDILNRGNKLPPPPDKLKKMGSLALEIVYDSQIQISQRKSKALAISTVLQQAAPLFELDPKYAKRINGDRTLQILGEANGAPASMFNTDDEQAAADQATVQQQQLTNVATIAGPASQAIKNISDAQRAAGAASPGNIPG